MELTPEQAAELPHPDPFARLNAALKWTDPQDIASSHDDYTDWHPEAGSQEEQYQDVTDHLTQ